MVDTETQIQDEWIEDCIRSHGRVLRGKHAHYCSDWDFMPVDETLEEFKSCTCSDFR